MYVFDEIHNQVLSIMQRVQIAAMRVDPEISKEALNRKIDEGLMVAFPSIAKTLEDAQVLRTSVRAEQASKGRAAKARAAKATLKPSTGNKPVTSKREKAILELEALHERLAKLEEELMELQGPHPFHGVYVTVNRDGDLWRVRGTRLKRTTLLRDADLEAMNKLAKAVETLVSDNMGGRDER